jgi:CubicO group peptidase (beta-lactamase class C family)
VIFSETVEARARLRDKANTNQHNLLCKPPSAPGNLTPSQGEGAMDTTSENQAATVRDQDNVWPVRVIRRGDAVRPLPPHARSLEDLTFEVGDVRLNLGDYMARSRTAGLLILKGGEIALERYGMGSGPERRWTSYSTAKSITATLVGAALHDGAFSSLDDRCDLYLPRLRLGL